MYISVHMCVYIYDKYMLIYMLYTYHKYILFFPKMFSMVILNLLKLRYVDFFSPCNSGLDYLDQSANGKGKRKILDKILKIQ